MKRIILSLIIVLSTLSVFAQKGHERKAEYYAEAAAKEFDLNKKEQQDVYDHFLALRIELAGLYKKVKTQELTQSEMQPKARKATDDYRSYLMDLTGKNKQEVEAFITRMRAELKQMK